MSIQEANYWNTEISEHEINTEANAGDFLLAANGWNKVQCSNCGGYGVVAKYSMYDFEGQEECNSCEGSGMIWISKNGRIADYPGGPFRGSISTKVYDER